MDSPLSDAGGGGRMIRIAAGPLVGLALFAMLPGLGESGGAEGLSHAARATIGVAGWMAIWWLTEAIEIAVTALLPLLLFPLVGVASFRDAARPYADPLIFLFLGGFVLALAMQRWGLDRRFALLVLSGAGTKPSRMIGAVMLVTASLSMFVSNTATAAMMLPIGLSLIALVRPAGGQGPRDNFSPALLLGIAYAASIGGIGTIIGTPPNAFLVGFAREAIRPEHRMEIGFAQWLVVGLPLVAVMLPAAWLLLTHVLYPQAPGSVRGGAALVRERLRGLGRPSAGEVATFVVFLLTAAAWIGRPLLQRLSLDVAGRTLQPFAGLSDSGIAIGAAILLFVVPVDRSAREFAMDWPTARGLPWGVLLLFGGGLSLAARIQEHGVADFLGALVRDLPRLPTSLLVATVALGVLFLTELTSNTATTATLLPILAGLAPGLGVDPYLLVVPAALSASCAFMMPVATPPNAIVFGSGRLSIPQMCRAGLLLNLVGAVVITLLTLLVVPFALGLR